jgi:hypothetical protein
VWPHCVLGRPNGSVWRPPLVHEEMMSHNSGHLASTTQATAEVNCRLSLQMTIPMDQRSKWLPETQNDPISLLADLYLPFQQHNVAVWAQHGGCRFQEDAFDHECVRGLEKQGTDIAGRGDDLSIIDTHPVDEDVN